MAREYDTQRIRQVCEVFWEKAIMPTLMKVIRIPALSPHFDPLWQTHGFLDEIIALALAWAKAHALPGMAMEIIQLKGCTPVLLIELPGSAPGRVLLYGHLDKQPEMNPWAPGLGPWQPVLRDERLYGRGGADDGYAVFAALAALHALYDQGIPTPTCIILIETGEESGSPDLPAYLHALEPRIGTPDLVIALDSGCGNYQQLWYTTSLRGLASGILTVDVLAEGVHSGDAGGIVPDSFRLLRLLLERLEEAASGRLVPSWLHTSIPSPSLEQARAAADVLGATVHERFPWLAGCQPQLDDPTEAILERTWKPALAITGADGLPPTGSAGNVLRPGTTVKLALRLPPTLAATQVQDALADLLTREPPHGARVQYHAEQASDGWQAPSLAPWLDQAIQEASLAFFGRPALAMGEGGTIPFIAMLARQFPKTQLLITGVLGPQANAHGPNEFLHLPTARALSASVALVLAQCATAAHAGDTSQQPTSQHSNTPPSTPGDI